MFCPSCGAETKEGLRYCNRCGANLLTEKAPPPKLIGVILAIVGAIVAIAGIGVFLLFVFATETLSKGGSGEVIVFLMLFVLMIFGIEALLVRQLSRLLNVFLNTGGNNRPAKNPTTNKSSDTGRLNELHEAKTAQIGAQTTLPIDAEQMTRKLENETK